MIDLRRVPDLWRRCDVTVRDFPFALLMAVISLLPAFHGKGTQVGDLPARPFDALALVVIALECLPLAVRRRWPALCLALVSLGFALDQIRVYHAFAGTALPIALISAGAHLERHRRVTVVLLSAAYVPLAVALGRLGSTEGPEGFVVFYLLLVLAWGIGAWLRSTRAAEAERRRRVAEATRAAERTRIARELHDVVTHHVTAMVVQAEAARYLTAAPDRLDAALSAVTDTGRRAIADLRHLLDLLNPDHSDRSEVRMPSVGELRTLVEQTRLAGQPVEFAEEGSPAESAGSAEFVAYRVVQESLTNALKYAHGSQTEVRVRYGEKEIIVEVGTDGSGSPAGSPGGSGRGLAGLRERVETLGGEFNAGRRTGGGFVVRARIPAGSPS
ncbi:sensor histidine kinase [Microbispora sp. GKU 823]|uniref:sensor histidine kinase n=1 Tax=Microbispora sp. GKU 823 TaxID=1652100 RepID=UPI0009A36ED5|nr:histidine kinase [Microbispora sp. GKU 823]OPG08050.1 two-component sensor histidine kinase [Microbispora sp. GKU 823]